MWSSLFIHCELAMQKKILLSLLLISPFYSYADSELERIIQAQGQLLTEYQQKVIELQGEVDQLRGRQDETEYKLEQAIERQKIILAQLEDGISAKSNNSQISSAAVTTLVGWSPTGNDKTDYNVIIKFVLAGTQSKEAIIAFQQFLKDYPRSSYRANVNYWLGQLNYNQGRKDDASFYFASVVKDYPKSDKAGDSLYKVGLILLEKKEIVKAKAVFQQVISKYPNDKKSVGLANNKLATL